MVLLTELCLREQRTRILSLEMAIMTEFMVMMVMMPYMAEQVMTT